MAKKIIDINWEEVMNKFASYKGTIVDFCKENNIKEHQLYYQRKRLDQNKLEECKPTFHAISINKEETIQSAAINTTVKATNDIRIEIGKVNVYIPVEDKSSLLSIIKELAKSC